MTAQLDLFDPLTVERETREDDQHDLDVFEDGDLAREILAMVTAKERKNFENHAPCNRGIVV